MGSRPQQIGNYELDREIGRGATSEVWLGHHAHLEQRQVAVKILMSQDRETVLRFSREANLTSRLEHPNIAQVLDYGYYEPFYCTVMEYIHGGSLQHLLDKQHRLDPKDALAIFKQIAAALDHAHMHNIIHRDVSPGNVLIEQSTGRALLTDFGIAREPNKTITASSAIMGTPGYLSPEHVESAASVTRLSDIYSLGVVLYAMLSGELPWDDIPSLPERQFGPPLPLRERDVPNLPKDIDRVFQVLLAEDPAKRYPSAWDAAHDLEAMFARHHVQTQVNTAGESTQETSLTGNNGSGPDLVETILGPDLVRVPIIEAHHRAEEMQHPEVIAALLNDWSEEGRLRRELLGRLAQLHKVDSHNIYFYRLEVLYEYRSQPYAYEEPDLESKQFPLTPTVDPWQVRLPDADGFRDDPGNHLLLPGSARVTSCDTCDGNGVMMCQRCKGKGRIQVLQNPKAEGSDSGAGGSGLNILNLDANNQPATLKNQPERSIIPCPDCDGRGGFTCERCAGVGRLVQQQAFRWQRSTDQWEAVDDLPDLDAQWIAQHCEMHEIYREESIGGFRPEWSLIPEVAALIQQAEENANSDTHIGLSAVTVSFVPISDITFDLGHKAGQEGEVKLYRLSIYGFENIIPPDWRFLDWERVAFVCGASFLLILTLLFGIFAFF